MLRWAVTPARRASTSLASVQVRWKTRRVYLCSSNEHKLPEFKDHFERYGIEVCVAPPPEGRKCWGAATKDELEPHMQKLLEEVSEKYWVKALLREQTTLYAAGEKGRRKLDWKGGEMHDCQRVVVESELEVWQLPASEQTRLREMSSSGQLRHAGDEETASEDPRPTGTAAVQQYRTEAEGYIDMSKRADGENVFGWDSVFVSRGTSLSYHEKKGVGCKVSPRNMNIDRYIAEYIHYKKRKVMRWSTIEQNRTIQFGERSTARDFVLTNEYLNNAVANRTGLTAFFRQVVNTGLFFRSGKTRRECNYWLPGLNAGVPLTAKRDAVHEICFTAHDFGHFVIPDLVFTGEVTPQLRRVYIVCRMLSEAVTMILADMVFVESLRQSGVEYDWTKRRIHPLLQMTGLSPLEEGRVDMAALRRLLEANVAYCLLGEDEAWCGLVAEHAAARGAPADEVESLRKGDFDAIKQFKDKYMPFFVEDYRWTARNWESMSSRADQFKRWWRLVEPLHDAGLGDLPAGMGLETVDQFAAAISAESAGSGRELVRRCFDRMFETRIRPTLELKGSEIASEDTIRRRAFTRYMMGQMIVFARYSFVPETDVYAGKLRKYLLEQLPKGVSPAQCDAARSLYEQYLSVLVDRGVLSGDDESNFAEVCPLFDPFFVFYDEDKGFYQNLSELRKDVLGDDAATAPAAPAAGPRETACLAVVGQRQLPVLAPEAWWDSVGGLPLAGKLRGLLRGGGVRFWDSEELFVRRPSVALCAVGGIPLRLSATGRPQLALGQRSVDVDLDDVAAGLRTQMGLAANPSFLNPRNVEAQAMFDIICKHRHFSVGHTGMLSFAVLGHSCAVENEFNSQRDVVHLSRLTVARTGAERDPPIVVPHPELLPVYQQLREKTAEVVKANVGSRPEHLSLGDWQEGLFTSWPAGKAQLAVMSGTLRNLQKLVGGMDDGGKEAEYRVILWHLNHALHALLPDMFQPCEAYTYRPPDHWR
eukprot:TRINITY_DN11951_c0_g1_i1.p1 TRINITY_DN11951_c0_g1~~TRINITY_DN11951_c0_g1_i1.p1  ORF type:complete len:987 (+),score=305.28 TRINITY_DN11951_c0_g1_i1:96-3056(+)